MSMSFGSCVVLVKTDGVRSDSSKAVCLVQVYSQQLCDGVAL